MNVCRRDCVIMPLRASIKNDGKIAVARAGDEIARVLLVARSVRDDEFSFGRREVAVCDIDRDALLAFGLQAVGQEREIDAFAAAPFVFALRAFDLILKCALSFDKQSADERRFSVIDIAGGGESKNVTAQKYPSRFLSSMVLAPWSMILVERSLILAETVSSAISSSVDAQDATAPVHGAQPSVRKRTDIFSGTSPSFRCIASSAGMSVPLRSNDQSFLCEVERHNRDFLLNDVLPDVAFRPVRERERRASFRLRRSRRCTATTIPDAACRGSHWPNASRNENTRSFARDRSSSRRAPPIAASN